MADSGQLRATSYLLPDSLQLPEHGTIVNSAADPHDRSTQDRVVAGIFRPYFFPRQPLHLPFERPPLRVAQIAGAGDLRLRETKSSIQFMAELLYDRVEKMHPAVLDQDRHKISYWP